MALNSSGCKAMVEEVVKVADGYIVATIYTCRKFIDKKGNMRYPKDWELRVLLRNPNNEVLNKGDKIIIKHFYIQNIVSCRHLESCTIDEWEIDFRNKYKSKYYEKSKEAQEAVAQAQKEAIEAEMRAQDAELDALIGGINEDDECPF